MDVKSYNSTIEKQAIMSSMSSDLCFSKSVMKDYRDTKAFTQVHTHMTPHLAGDSVL